MSTLVAAFDRVVLRQTALAADLVAGHGLAVRWLELALLMAASAGVYGAALGIWHGPTLALYVSIKLPLVLLLTSALTMVFNWVAYVSFGLRLSFGQVGALTFFGLATASVLLASLAPVALFFTLCAPPPTPTARTAHNLLYLMHTGFVAGCGLRGQAALWSALLATGAAKAVVARVYLTWLVAYAVVGGKVAWALRPFVGSVSLEHPLVFLRADALEGNVYEFIIRDIVPHLLR